MNAFSSMDGGNEFRGYGWLVKQDKGWGVIDLTDPFGTRATSDILPVTQSKFSKYPEQFVVPVFYLESSDSLVVEDFDTGLHCTYMMIRKWEEFEEYSSTKSFEKWVTEQGEKTFVTPRFKVLGRTLLVEDSGKTYCGFRAEEGRYSFEKAGLKKAKKKIFVEKNGLYKVANGQNLNIAGDLFRLIDLYKENNETESSGIKRNEEKWKSCNDFFNDSHFWEQVIPNDDRISRGLGGKKFPEDYVPKPSSDSFSPVKEDGSDFRLRFNEMFGGNHDYTIRYEPDREWTLPGKYRILFHLSEKRYIVWEDGRDEDLSFDFEILRDQNRPISEELAFLGWFKKYVAECGFKYADQDLARFHTSIKCGMFTLLGGAPGSGKSSLAALYSRAILGTTDLEKVREGFLAFDVNPSWMEPDELLGFWNLNDRYSCAATGLVPFLRQATGKNLALVCVEEMNLARVEHYFSNFIQMMSREPNERRLLGVPQDEGMSRNDFDNRNCLCLGENVRFVGTSNFDETTQRYSARFYDRCNYIELQPVEDAEAFPVLIPSFARGELSNGIPYEEFKSWICTDFESRSVSQPVQEKYKALKERLKPLGLLPSRRVDFAIHEYILNRPNWGLPQKDGELQDCQMVALDEAIAQRILPRYNQNYLRDESKPCDELQEFFDGSFPLSALFFKTKKTSDERPIPAT